MQADTTTLSDLIERLRTVGEKPPRKLFDDVLEHGQEAVTPLIEIVTDYPGDDPDADGRLYWATYHAIQLLGELRAADAIGPILDLLDEDDDYVDMYLPKSLAQIGQPAVEPLRAALVAPDADVYGVARAARALTEMVELYPELRSEIVGMLTERLDADIPNEDGYALRAFLISNLADLRAVEATPSVQRAFEDDLVDEMVIDLETYRLIAERPEGTSPHEALWPTTAKLDAQSASSARAPAVLPEPAGPAPVSRRAQPFGRKVGRNEACPCGSTKKYKRCHGR